VLYLTVLSDTARVVRAESDCESIGKKKYLVSMKCPKVPSKRLSWLGGGELKKRFELYATGREKIAKWNK
jgi:hypothetical protein